MARANERDASAELRASPLCAVARRDLTLRDAERRAAAEQRRFEAACARELLGELD
jgi:hypothetical protein